MKKIILWICFLGIAAIGAAYIFLTHFGKKYTLSAENGYFPIVYNASSTSWKALSDLLFSSNTRQLTHWNQADDQLVSMILTFEDKRFRIHPGVDPLAWIRAVWQYFDTWKVSGGSTIDQQVIKLIEQAYKRWRPQKFHEVASALLLQSNGKDAILTAYLNLLPFPYERRGIQQWCNLLFGLPCSALTSYQRLFLIATYQTGNNPYSEKWFVSIKNRADILCAVRKKKNKFMICDGEKILPQTKDDLSDVASSNTYDPLLVDLVTKEAQEWKTVFNIPLTEEINRVVDGTESWRDSLHGNDCCILVVDNAGQLISQTTCRSPEDDEGSYVNGCFQKRQVGSLMKPLVYLYALGKLWITMQDRIVDEEVSYDLPHGGVYHPQNFDLRYHGDVSLAEALASSLNIPAVKLFNEAWVDDYFPFFNRLRILAWDDEETISNDSEQFNADQLWLSAALGTYELSPYQAIRIRRLIYPHAIPTTTTNENLQRFSSLQSRREEITNVLADGSYRIHGFAHPERFTFPWRAIKTWTSRHYVDGRMCGVKLTTTTYKARSYAPWLTMCVWMWNYEWAPMDAAWADSAGILWGLVEELFK